MLIHASQIFGRPYSGFVNKIRDNYPRIKNLINNLHVSSTALASRAALHNSVVLALLDGLDQIASNSSAVIAAKEALSKSNATTTTFSFIMHYLKIASKNGVPEKTAANTILEKFSLILLCTAHFSYPSKRGKELIEIMMQSQQQQIEDLPDLFPSYTKEEIQAAVFAGFNPFNIINGIDAKPFRPMDENFRKYLGLSTGALRSYAYALANYYSPKPDLLWVFLMRDAHLLFLAAERDLPGKKIELDCCKVTLATQEETATIFKNNGFDIGTSKAPLSIEGYRSLQDEMGAPQSLYPPSPIRPSEVIEALLQKPPQSDSFSDQYQMFREAQETLRYLQVPDQIYGILETSGIAEHAERGKPVVFVDTGFKGTLPLVLQAALTNITTRKGTSPSVHVWLDYVQHQYRQYGIHSHQSGMWPVSPLDGCVSLNRNLYPTETGYQTDTFTTPFAATKQDRILRGFFEEDQKEGK